MKNYTNVMVKREMLDLLETLYKELDDAEKPIGKSYECVGKEEEQSKDWRTGELLWEDEEQTIPKYRDKWDWVEKGELDDNDKAKKEAIETIRKALDKLV